MKKSKMTMIIMFICVAVFLALFILFFVLGDGYKAQFKDLGVKIAGSVDDAEIAEWTKQRESINGLYTFCAFSSYLTSILALVSIGVGLFLSDKFKEAEEKAAELGQ